VKAERLSRLRRELSAAEQIPYTAHVTASVVRTAAGDLVQAFRLTGGSFECADDSELNNWHERLNVLWRNIASPNVALWVHLVRRREVSLPDDSFKPGFGADLYRHYYRRLSGELLMVNELYLSLVYRPSPGALRKWTVGALAKTSRAAEDQALAEALDACDKLAKLLKISLERYEPEVLGLCPASAGGGRPCSRLLQFLGLLINGEQRAVALPSAPLNEVLATSRILIGRELIEYRMPHGSRLGAMLAIKEYPTSTMPGLLNRLLSAPFPLLLTQSFAFMSRAAGQGLLQRQYHRMTNVGDLSQSQAQELKGALDALSSNSFAMGDHHFTLQILTECFDTLDASELPRQQRRLTDNLASARNLLADTGMTVAREDIALEASFWAQLPGHFGRRPRKAPITSRNFAALAPFHNYPSGRATDNHWGPALALLVTSSHSPFYFSLHASEGGPGEEGGRRDTGHTFLCGPTGSGKTVLIGFLITMLQRQGVSQVIFDKDRGLELLVLALGGTYLPLRSGIATGFNPLRLAPTPLNVDFLKTWLRQLVRRAGQSSAELVDAQQAADLDQALHGTLALEPAARRLSRLIEFLDPTEVNGIHARLSPWCQSTGGDYAWVFDNPEDRVSPLMHETPTIGFDVTEFLDHPDTRTPVTLYLFHLVRQLLDGRRLVCWLDEFWRMLSDSAFEQFAKDGPKTWRKLNAVMCLSTQSPSDVLKSPISRTIIEQTPTKVFFPCPVADPGEYQQGFGLSEREWSLISQQMEPGSRQFLVRQGRQSIVCRLDLRGMDEELAILSSRRSSIELAQQVLQQTGADPGRWLPEFHRLLRQKAAGSVSTHPQRSIA
jgi:type IV secretion system protein VirB4